MQTKTTKTGQSTGEAAHSFSAWQLGSRQPFWWVSLVFWGACAGFAWMSDQALAALILAIFAGLSLLNLCSRALITVDDSGITHRSRFALHRIDWHEMQRIETDGVTLVLVGNSKQMPLTPRFWVGKDGEDVRARLEFALARRGLPLVDNPLASRMTFRRTRVRRTR